MEPRLSGCLHKGYSAFKEKDFDWSLTKVLSVSDLGTEHCVSGRLQPGAERGPPDQTRAEQERTWIQQQQPHPEDRSLSLHLLSIYFAIDPKQRGVIAEAFDDLCVG